MMARYRLMVCCHVLLVVAAMLAFKPPPPSHRTRAIPRMREKHLNVDYFLTEHMLLSVPLVIELDRSRAATDTAALLDAVFESLSKPMPAMGPVTAAFLEHSKNTPLAILHQLQPNVQNKSLRALLSEAERSPWPLQPGRLASVVQSLKRWSQYASIHVLAGALALLELALAPAYLADVPLNQTSEAAAALLEQRGHSLSSIEDAVRSRLGLPPSHPHDQMPRFFLGAPGSAAYPLHQDLADGDVFFRVYRGAKRVAMFPEAEGPLLGRNHWLPPPASGRMFAWDPFISFADDSFAGSAHAPAGATGWSGADPFSTHFFRGMPTVDAEGQIDSEGSIGKVSARRVFGNLQIGTGPQRSPSACSEMLKKKRARRCHRMVRRAAPE